MPCGRARTCKTGQGEMRTAGIESEAGGRRFSRDKKRFPQAVYSVMRDGRESTQGPKLEAGGT